MSNDTLVSLVLGTLIGLISGFYTGIIVTRYARFAELRTEALRVIRAIDFIPDSPNFRLSNHEDAPKSLLLISSDLLFLGHRKAGERIAQLCQEVSTSSYGVEYSSISADEYVNRYATWQSVVWSVPPNMVTLCALWGRL